MDPICMMIHISAMPEILGTVHGTIGHVVKYGEAIVVLLQDAYVLIVQKVVESATLMDTALVGEDTDLLILLCYHASLIQAQNIF